MYIRACGLTLTLTVVNFTIEGPSQHAARKSQRRQI